MLSVRACQDGNGYHASIIYLSPFRLDAQRPPADDILVHFLSPDATCRLIAAWPCMTDHSAGSKWKTSPVLVARDGLGYLLE